MLIPAIVYIVVFSYLPMAGIVIAFKKFNYVKGIFGSDWNGLDNFRFLFKTHDAWVMTRNTLLYNFTFIILGTIAAIFVAVLMYELGGVWYSSLSKIKIPPELDDCAVTAMQSMPSKRKRS